MKCGLSKAIDTLELCQIRIYNRLVQPEKGRKDEIYGYTKPFKKPRL